MRKRLYDIIEISKGNDIYSTLYDIFMLLIILVSIIPLAFVEDYPVFIIIDKICVTVFIIDYLFRLTTADYKLKMGTKSFIIYPFTAMAIIDLIAILPSLSIINNSWKLLKIFRLFRTLRVFRIFKAFRYSKNLQLFIKVFKKEKDALLTIAGIAILYILVSALIVLNVEPETFGDYYHAVYWATVSLTTMGYGDIYPVTVQGQLVTMLSSFVGIAIVAMPAGIITAGFMDEINKQNSNNDNTDEHTSKM